MKNIYHIHQSSNSYWDSSWTDTDYFLCDSEEEYQELMAQYIAKRKKIEEEYKENPNSSTEWRYHNFHFHKEGKVHANEYYYGHEWCGKEFDAIGFFWGERLERSTHYKYFLKPGSVCNETRSSAVGRFTGYGS
jgi:hypothetical protein